MMVFFRTRERETLIRQKFYQTWEPDLKVFLNTNFGSIKSRSYKCPKFVLKGLSLAIFKSCIKNEQNFTTAVKNKFLISTPRNLRGLSKFEIRKS